MQASASRQPPQHAQTWDTPLTPSVTPAVAAAAAAVLAGPMVPNLVWGRCAGPMEPGHTVDPRRAAAHMALTSWKIWLAAKMLG
jgi:hypothetical protein